MRIDLQIFRGVRDAREHKAGTQLVIIQEAAVGLVHLSRPEFAGTSGAGTRATRVGQIESCLFRSV